MKRLHIALGITDLDQSVRFYRALFGAAPTLLKADYAKWMLEDPRVNFSISTRLAAKGLEHLGIQAESADELKEVFAGVMKAEGLVSENEKTTCCYAISDKTWVTDPDGVSWEAFQTFGESATYRGDNNACCG